jgi:2-polyprenyl-3-methyl-5-hydroxy-6-metoxy-1,4-benzoquinol methylase
MVHEVPNRNKFFHEIKLLLKPEGSLLLAEPTIHVTRSMFEQTLKTAEEVGFAITENPRIFMSRAVVLSVRRG